MDKEITIKQQIIDMLGEKTTEEINTIAENAKRLMTYYRCAILEIETKFRVLNEHFALKEERNPIESIKSRLKSFESIREKMARKGLPMHLDLIEETLSDVAGVRVVCGFLNDIYMLADCILRQDDVKLVAKKDYIQNPKPNGYRSLHLIVEIPIFLSGEKKLVRVEVQLRTIAMESWANLEHRLRYKKKLTEEQQTVMDKELSECAEMSILLDEKMQKLRNIVGD